MRNRTVAMNKHTAGVALLTALGLLFIFAVLGMGYVTYALTEVQGSTYSVKMIRVNEMARGGIEAAIGELQARMAAGDLAKLENDVKLEAYPQYGPNRKAPEGFSLRENGHAGVEVKIQDESGKINLNYAPPSVLQTLLGVDGDTARRIRNSVTAPDGEGRMIALEDLVGRKLVSGETFKKLPLSELSVVNVADPASVAESINVNKAKPEILAAVFGLTPDEAKAMDAKRPFAAVADVVAATGKDPALYNLKPAGETPGTLPVELGLQSRCFRLVSNASFTEPGSREAKARAEAVVVFTKEGVARITYWSERPEVEQASQDKKAQ